MTRQRVLVTGAGGFVGRHLCEALTQRRVATEVVKLVNHGETIDGGICVDVVDRAALDDIVAQTKPDVTIHLAAQSSAVASAIDIHDTWAVNLSGSLNLALAVARHAPNSTILFVSSSEVYGASFLRGPVSEITTTLPMNAYAKSKRLAEDMFDAVMPSSAQLIVARPFNHSGPGQGENFALPSLASQVARIEAGLQPPKLRAGNINVMRDFMHVRDVVAAYLALIDTAHSLPRRFLCNVASERARSLSEAIDILQGFSRRAFEIAIDPARVRALDIPVASGEAKLLRLATGWRPIETFESLLESLLESGRRTVKMTNG